MPSSAFQIPFLASNSTVKAWCLTSNHFDASASPTQASFDGLNFIDGYNLRLDLFTNSIAGNVNYTAALKFSFIKPLDTDKYRVFVRGYGSNYGPVLAHSLNSTAYPKTKDSFWIRLGYLSRTNNLAPTSAPANQLRSGNQVFNLRLWNNATSSLGIVVM